MPIKVSKDLPAIKELAKENIFVMDELRAITQDIRPLKIIIVNLMPTKQATETQFIRLLSNTSLQVEVTLLRMESYDSKHVSEEYLDYFYKTFSDIKDQYFDGMIITGAPVENLAFEEVEYWPELVSIMEWSASHVFSTMHICWGAQAGLYHHYNIEKYPLKEKLFGVFKHTTTDSRTMLLRGFDDEFFMPHSRHTDVRKEDIEACSALEILATSEEAGVSIVRSRDNRFVFVTGHAEYDFDTLDKEYKRDVALDRPINIPVNYYPGDDPSKRPVVRWRGHANILFVNWLNYFVYQETPFDLQRIHELRNKPAQE